MPQYEDTVTDSVTMSSPLSAEWSASTTVDQSVTMSSPLSAEWSASTTVDQSVTLTSNTSAAYIRQLLDSLSCTDNPSSGWLLQHTVLDEVELEDSNVQNLIFSVLLSKVISINPKVAIALSGYAEDTIIASDVVIAAVCLTVLDQLKASDILASSFKYGSATSDSVKMADALLRFVGASAYESVNLSTSTLFQGITPAILSDMVNVTDSVTPLMVISASLDDGVDVSDEMILSALYAGEILDGVKLSAAFVSNSEVLTWAMNLSTKAISRYAGFDFTSYALVGNRYLATNEHGLYELYGDTDDGNPIISLIRSGIMQFTGANFSSPDTAYLAVRGEGLIYLRIIDEKGGKYTYRVSADSMRTAKAKLGRGLRIRYFSFELETVGQDFDLESIEFTPLKLTRKV